MTLSVDIRHAFPNLRLGIRFEAPPGITVLFGRSGSGKTTVVNSVAGLLRPDAGRILCKGETFLDTGKGIVVPPHRRGLGYVFQDARLFPHLTVRRNLNYGRWFARKRMGSRDTGKIIDMLDLGDLLGRRPGTLSGGEKQRVAIGRALLADPKILLADEPLASLDDARKAEIIPYLERLRDEVAIPVLYVTHASDEVARLASQVVVIRDGRIVRQGPAIEVLGDPMVTPLGVRGAGAVLEARVAKHHADGLSELDAGGLSLFIPHVPQAPGSVLRVRVPAQDVILSRQRPEGLSALNILPGTVEAIRTGDGPGAIVSLATPAGGILARVTARSAAALDLAPGVACFAIVKSMSIAPQDIGGPYADLQQG